MSRETLTHLNTSTLIGNTDDRGHAWHYRAEEQGEESNHYPGPVPIEDAQRRLFAWTAQSRPLAVEVPSDLEAMSHLTEDGAPARWVVIEDRQAICRSDDDRVMGIFSSGYERHQYAQWLLSTVADILDDDLAISSAGLLRDGSVAWVEVSVPETITTPEGVAFRPNLLATTSFDGSIATTFKRTITDVVCDNTRDLALGEVGQQFKVKHSRNSQARLAPAREALALIHTMGDAFAAEVATLCSTAVGSGDWFRIAQELKEKSPEHYEFLRTFSVPGQYIGDGAHLMSSRPVFRFDQTGELVQVSFNNGDRAPFLLEPAEMKKFYDALRSFEELANDERLQWQHVLAPGEAMLFDNWRVLHGRKAYTGTRTLCGAYLNHEDFESRLRRGV